MKNIALLLILNFVFYSCNSNDDEAKEPIVTDISISTSVSLINWINEEDLQQKLENIISYDYGLVRENKIEKQQLFNSDKTQVTATIDFKQEFRDAYKDPNTFNNSVTIDLVQEISNPEQVLLKADGAGNTYELITSVLAPGSNPIEAPDCGHMDFGEHIDEIFDNDLNAHVFRFYIHTDQDNDRCINFDRQRNEIKSFDKSPDNTLGVENEKVIYRWKFKLPAGFQSSPKFTHIHQLKSVGCRFSARSNRNYRIWHCWIL